MRSLPVLPEGVAQGAPYMQVRIFCAERAGGH
jgi:hypothetical protein